MANISFEKMFNLYIDYKRLFKKEPDYKTIFKNENLGIWVNRKRTIYNKGILRDDGSIFYNNYILTKEEIQKLNSVNFPWIFSDYIWNNTFDLFVKWLKDNGGIYPKRNDFYEDINLGNWVAVQRAIFLNGVQLENGDIKYDIHGTLKKYQIDKLNSINFRWIQRKNKYYNSKINTKDDNNKKQRYLLYELNKLLLNMNKEIKTKEDITSINKEYNIILTR